MGYSFVSSGWLCISLFFSFSGFLITSLTVQRYEKAGEIDILKFWSLRIGRLFPALLLTIVTCALSRFLRVEDEKELWYERNDLLWGVTFLTNYNLIFVRKDDYFDEFTKPSITRHMWSLAIEEQYYVIWPLVFFVFTRLFPQNQNAKLCTETKSAAGKDREDLAHVSGRIACRQGSELPPREPSDGGSLRRFLVAVCVGECTVVILSYFSSLATISNMGISAAYYSTWCRMGDLACGGLAFLLARLCPSIYKRIQQEPGLAPMKTTHRLLLEVLWFFAICLTVLPATIQAPFEEVASIYFRYARLPMSFFLLLFSMAGVIQISEPIPRWAIFSRALSGKLLTMLGSVSYGIYLYHWPIILFFGRSGVHKAQDENDNFLIWEEGGTPEEGMKGENTILETKDTENKDQNMDHLSLPISASRYSGLLLHLLLLAGLSLLLFGGWKATFSWNNSRAPSYVATACMVIFPIILVFLNKFLDAINASDVGNETFTEGIIQLSNFGIDVLVMLFSVVSGVISFFWLELPILLRARRSKPLNVIALGMLGAATTAAIVFVSFLGVTDPDVVGNDLETLFSEMHSRPASNVSVNTGGSIPTETFKDLNMHESIEDSRRTPVSLFTKIRADVTLNDILDEDSLPTKHIPCKGLEKREHEVVKDNALQCGWHATPEVYKQIREMQNTNAVIIMCNTYSAISPCDTEPWAAGTKWIWLDSNVLCGEHDWKNSTDAEMAQAAQDEKCPQRLQIASVRINLESPTEIPWWSYTGRTDDDMLLLANLVVAVEKNIPGSINRKSLGNVEMLIAKEERKALQRKRATHNSTNNAQLVGEAGKVLVMGESVAVRMARMLKELLDVHMPCIKQHSTEKKSLSDPTFEIVDGANNGMPALLYFLPCEIINGTAIHAYTCVQTEKKKRELVIQSMSLVRPYVIIVHDSHWQEAGMFANQALAIFLQQAIKNNVKHVFFVTSSVSGEGGRGHIAARMELRRLEKFLQRAANDNACAANSQHLSFTIIKWHLLTCPGFEEKKCSQSAHGFYKILPDGTHPSGEAGTWLSAQVLALVAAQVTYLDRLVTVDGAWEDAMRNSMSSCLLSENKPDNDPPLKDLVDSQWVCEETLIDIASF